MVYSYLRSYYNTWFYFVSPACGLSLSQENGAGSFYGHMSALENKNRVFFDPCKHFYFKSPKEDFMVT